MSYIDLIGMLAVICIGAMIILGGAVLWFAGSIASCKREKYIGLAFFIVGTCSYAWLFNLIFFR